MARKTTVSRNGVNDLNLRKIRYELGDMIAQYLIDDESGQVSLALLPEGMQDAYDERRYLTDTYEYVHAPFRVPAWSAGHLCHLALGGFPQSTGAGGGTMKHGPVCDLLKLEDHRSEQKDGMLIVTTTLAAAERFAVVHTLTWREGEQGVEMRSEFINRSNETMMLDMLTSFSLDNLSPFDQDVSADRLVLHRWHGGWSLEGKHITDSVEKLNLDRAWHPAFAESERFGCVGAYTTKRYFPMAAVEDTISGVTWAAQLSCGSSWQMELSRIHDGYSFSGGIADFEFGHWRKSVAPGETFASTTAYVTVAKAAAALATQRLVRMHRRHRTDRPPCEADLPVVFNEWCTSWGFPTEKEILDIAERLNGLPVRYIVIDAGWSEAEVHFLGQSGNGDWILDRKSFPSGLKALSQKLAPMGLKLGIWFEFEVTTRGARVFEKDYDAMHLKRDGHVIFTGNDRTFWDFRKPEVIEYLTEKVIHFLRDNQIGYLKVDYNGDPGATCDGAESGGEGIRQQMLAVQTFFRKMREMLPELVIENCSSGGHRLEPAMMNITSMSSFSDAHESSCFPYIAANVHELFLPEQSQIWAVLWDDMSRAFMEYRLCAGFLGRICLSGGLDRLHDWQMDVVREALAFYQKVKHIIKDGVSERTYACSHNMYKPTGAQAVVRRGDNGDVLVVAHSFELNAPKTFDVAIPSGLKLADSFGAVRGVTLHEDRLTITFDNSFNALALFMTPEAGKK